MNTKSKYYVVKRTNKTDPEDSGIIYLGQSSHGVHDDEQVTRDKGRADNVSKEMNESYWSEINRYEVVEIEV